MQGEEVALSRDDGLIGEDLLVGTLLGCLLRLGLLLPLEEVEDPRMSRSRSQREGRYGEEEVLSFY